MSTLTGLKPKNTYPWLLNVGASDLTSTRAVTLGNGTATPLSLTATDLFVGGIGLVKISGGNTIAGTQSFSGDVNITGKLTTALPKVSAYKSANQNSMTAGAYVMVTFDTEEYDTANLFSGSQFTAPYGCYVRVTVNIYVGGGTTGQDSIAIHDNGTLVKRIFTDNSLLTGTIINGSATLYVASGHTLDIRYYGQFSRSITGAQSITWVTYEILP